MTTITLSDHHSSSLNLAYRHPQQVQTTHIAPNRLHYLFQSAQAAVFLSPHCPRLICCAATQYAVPVCACVMLRKGQWLTMRASRQLFQHPNAPPAAPQQACMHPARCAPKRIATRAAASSPTPAAATSTAAAEQYRAVAAWRLALLQANSSSLSDYSLVWRLKGTTFNNRQVCCSSKASSDTRASSDARKCAQMKPSD